MANYYEILEVNEKASIEVIDKAYKALAKKYHPDIYSGDKKEAEKMMQKLNEAYDVLSNEEKRKNYDNILERKRQLQKAKESVAKSSNTSSYSNQNVHNSTNRETYSQSEDSPINNPAKYNKDQFVVDTTYMDEKQKKKIQKKLQERYIEAYDNYLRLRGYKLKYKWTFKRICMLILVTISVILLFTVLYFIPPIHNYLVNLYNTNAVLKVIVDIIVAFFSAIFSTISQLFA